MRIGDKKSALLTACWAWALAAQGAPAGPVVPALVPLRVCLPDVEMPPYTSRDPVRPGLFQRLLVDAGRAAGLQVQVQRLPSARCRLALASGEAEAMPLPATAGYLQELDFPLVQSKPDAGQRLARLQFVLLRRGGEAWDWDGQRLAGGRSPLVGIRWGVRTLNERLQLLGLAVDDKAVSNEQLLHKLAARRIDLAAMSREEFLQTQRSLPGLWLEMLVPPLLTADVHLAVSRRLQGPARERVAAWREQISRLRESPAYQVDEPLPRLIPAMPGS